MNYVDLLIGLKNRSKISRYRLSKLSGLPESTIQNWETGGKIPSIDNYAQALEAMGYEIKIVKIEE